MKRLARLQAARRWLATRGGDNAIIARRDVRAYAKWFGVDLGCALKELRMLGVEVDARYAEQLVTTLRNRGHSRPTKPAPTHELDGYGSEWDDHFACIAGFTPGGMPFGVTWEDAEQVDDEPWLYDSA